MLYVSERICNIGDLEDLLKEASLLTQQILRNVKTQQFPGRNELLGGIQKLHKVIGMATDFEFRIERRLTTGISENLQPQEKN